MREVIARIVDGSEFDEFKRSTARRWSAASRISSAIRSASWPTTASCFRNRALKGAHFIELCSQRGMPLVFLQNITGFMVGPEIRSRRHRQGWRQDGDRGGLRAVPKFTVMIGGSFGAGNYGMCGRAYDPRFLWMWPNARISVMGGEQAASVLATVRGRSSGSAQEEEAFKAPIREQYEAQGHPYYATARLWDDGIIDPADTRRVLGLVAIRRAERARSTPTRFGVFRM